MKRPIAEFLGELAEELGWEPEFEGQRVVPERHAASSSVAIHDMPSSNEMRLQRLDEELRHLRSNVNHLSSETTQLRAEMARLKKLPAPPDAQPNGPTAAATGGEVRQWPAHLLPKPASEPAPPVRDAVTRESAKNDMAPAEPARDATGAGNADRHRSRYRVAPGALSLRTSFCKERGCQHTGLLRALFQIENDGPDGVRRTTR